MERLICKVETIGWSLEIVGQLPTIAPFIVLAPNTTIEIDGMAQISIYERTLGDLTIIAPGSAIEPLFFENTRYDFYFSHSNNMDLEINFPPAASLRYKKGNLTHYSLDFQNNVGFVEIKVSDSVNPISLRFEVFPYKIDYRTDYIQMRDEISLIARNLAMTIQSRTFGFAVPFDTATATMAEWLSLIRYYFKKLVATVSGIEQNPHSKMVEKIYKVSLERAHPIHERSLDRQIRTGKPETDFIIIGVNRTLPRRVPINKHRVTFDTPENQYVKSFLFATLHNLQLILKSDANGDEDVDLTAEKKFFKSMRQDAEMMRREIQRLIRTTFLKEVDNVPLRHPNSLVFHRHPHYAAFEKIAHILNNGLSLDGGVLRIGIKNIALLYEYWCFLRMIKIFRERFQLDQQSIIKVSHHKTTVLLEKGQQASIQFYDPISGKKLSIIYNRFFTRLPTIAQRPDNIIQIASDSRLYIFDAKYRLSFDEEYQTQFDGIGPTTDDINTMHRYRDAIVIQDPNDQTIFRRGSVQSALVLFPLTNEADYQRHRFFQSIKKVKIGGLPFLPQTTSLVEGELAELLKQEGFPS